MEPPAATSSWRKAYRGNCHFRGAFDHRLLGSLPPLPNRWQFANTHFLPWPDYSEYVLPSSDMISLLPSAATDRLLSLLTKNFSYPIECYRTQNASRPDLAGRFEYLGNYTVVIVGDAASW